MAGGEGRFRPVVRNAIERNGREFPIEVSFRVAGGYSGFIRVKIEKTDTNTFQADWENEDWTRFPARIRAAATALLDTKQFGTFLIAHEDGTLLIREYSAL